MSAVAQLARKQAKVTNPLLMLWLWPALKGGA
jgi:hypothetical protein